MNTLTESGLYGWVARNETYKKGRCSVGVYVSEIRRDKMAARMRELGLEVMTFKIELPSFPEKKRADLGKNRGG